MLGIRMGSWERRERKDWEGRCETNKENEDSK